MTDQMQTILLIGATSGLGEALARALHAQGKTLILTGRRVDRLDSLKQDLPGSETITWDITDLSTLGSTVDKVLKSHPALDTVIVNSGIMQSFSLFDHPGTESSANVDIPLEVATNITAPFLLAQHFIPHLSSIAEQGRQSAFLITSSGLGFVPMGFWPVYCATKAAVHSFLVSARHQVSQSASQAIKANLNIVEIVPPYVEETGIGAGTKGNIESVMKNLKGMSVEEWTRETMEGLARRGEDGTMLKEVAAGSAKGRVEMWRGSMGGALVQMGIDA